MQSSVGESHRWRRRTAEGEALQVEYFGWREEACRNVRTVEKLSNRITLH